MNENELRTLDEEVKDLNLFTTDTVEVEENDGPGFGLGVLIGTGIGVAAAAIGKRVVKFVQSKRAKAAPAATEDAVEAEVVTEDGEPVVLDMTKNKKK